MMVSTYSSHIIKFLLMLLGMAVIISCGSDDVVSTEEVERAVEAITTQEDRKKEAEEKESEMGHMDTEEAEVYVQKVEEEKVRKEAKIAASPYLVYAEDLSGVATHLQEMIDDADGDCKKVSAFMEFWNQNREDPIFLSAMKDRAIKKEVTTQYKRALALKANCP